MPFLARVLNQQRYPAYYRDMAGINSNGAALLGRRPSPPAKLSASEVDRLMTEGAAVVDVRQGRHYDGGHIPGSYSVGMDGPFSAWVGWLIPRGRPIVLAGGTDTEHREAQRHLQRIGFDRISGALDGGMDSWQSSGRVLSTFETVDIEDMAEWIVSAQPMTCLLYTSPSPRD